MPPNDRDQNKPQGDKASTSDQGAKDLPNRDTSGAPQDESVKGGRMKQKIDP